MFFSRKKSFNPPWNIPLPARIQTLTQSSKKNVIYIYEKPDSSTFRYRVYNMCQALEGSKSWEGHFFFENEVQELLSFFSKINVIVLCRTRWSFTLDHFIEQAKCNKIPLLFDIDDLIFNPDKIPLVMNTLNVSFRDDQISHWFAHSSRLLQLGKKCNGTIGTNAYISERLSQAFNTPNFTVNNFLNREQIEASALLFKNKPKKSKFTMGYFSGSPSHANDFAKIAPEIANMLSEFPDMHLEVAGFMDFPVFLKPFVKKQIFHTPFVDFVTLQTKIASVDVNLVPLVENEFTNCKSELKFFEAAIVGTPTLATPTHVYQQNIQHGKTGYLCEEGDWHPTVKSIYEGKVPPGLKEKANLYCLNKYAPKSQLASIEEMLQKAICILE
jgi:glycosyltransferase involved in cell wall biosynthesis